MKKIQSIIRNLALILGIVAIILQSGCKDDIPEELTSLNTSRLFSPTGLDARVVNQTSVRLVWKAVKNAKSYAVEVFENGEQNFSGSPVRTVSDVAFEQLPLILSGFAGETDYSVRVKAIGQEIPESKWISATFTTDPEQILFPVNPEEIAANEVILRWPAGEIATTIVLAPGNIVHQVTAQEVAAGAATITGLSSETEYSARLMNGDKTRGLVLFKTLIDLGGATPVHPEDDLLNAILNTEDGGTLVLFPGEYNVYQGDIALTRSITIKGLYPHNKPVIYNRFLFYEGVNDATFADLEMVGIYGDPVISMTQAFNFEAGTYQVNSVTITGCIIRNYSRALIYGGSAVLKLENLTVYNTIVSDILCDGGDFIDFRTGYVMNLTITNSTFNKVATFPRDFIRLDNSSGAFPGSTSKVLIDRCTFYDVSNTRRILYVRFIENENVVRNSVFAGSGSLYEAYYTNQNATSQPECFRNNYFNAPRFLGGDIANGKFDISGTHTILDPGFVNPGADNFRITNEDLILFGIGDPRWMP